MILPIVLPVRNGSAYLSDTIISIKTACFFAGYTPYIVVVDDGSNDDSAKIALSHDCLVVYLPDRGFSVSGKPDLALVYNVGCDYIRQHIIEYYPYIFITDSSSILAENYIALLVDKLESNLYNVICHGVYSNITFPSNFVSAMLIRDSFFSMLRFKFPINYYSWFTYPILYAKSKGFKTHVVLDAKMSYVNLEDNKNHGFIIGREMYETGFTFLYALLKSVRFSFIYNRKIGYHIIKTCLFSSGSRYPSKLRALNRKFQYKTIKGF
jgi:glycosyltransferase involved in cell wall biosynthesis